MEAKRRKCVFNDELRSKYSFIKTSNHNDNSEVQCLKCKSVFSIANSGKTDIENHINTIKHKRAMSAAIASSSMNMTSYFKKRQFDDAEKKLAAAEGLWAYHTVMHNHSFRSMDCTCKLIKACFDAKFTCSRTKCEAIISDVLVPYANQLLEDDLSAVNFVSIYTDASNHKEIKIIPIMVRYFSYQSGINVKILEVKDFAGETSDIVTDYILEVLKQHHLETKILGFCADNTNTNFGGMKRSGRNNIFTKLKSNLGGRELVGIGCAAHILNNAIQTAADCLPVDVQIFISKMYSYFYIYTVRVNELKEFCEFVDIEYKKLLGYSATRWLALRPAVERVLQIYPALKSYFASNSKSPTIIKNYFDNPETELWLYFLHNVSSMFHIAVLKIEGQDISIIETSNIYNDLKTKLEERKVNVFLPLQVRQNLKKLEEEGLINSAVFKEKVVEFYETCIQYLDNWKGHFQHMEKFDWILLNTQPTHHKIQVCSDYILQNFQEINLIEDELFDEICFLLRYTTDEKITHWKQNSVSVSNKWIEIFKAFSENNVAYTNVGKLVEYGLCLPGTNAATERVFTFMNSIWTSDKTQLQVETLKCMLITKCNFNLNCTDFYENIRRNDSLLKPIHSSEKYKKQK